MRSSRHFPTDLSAASFTYDPSIRLAGHATLVGDRDSSVRSFIETAIQQQIMRGGGYLFIDTESQPVVQSWMRLEHAKSGRLTDFQVLDLTRPEASATYNPIVHGQADHMSSALTLLRSVRPQSNDGGWATSMNYILTGILSAVRHQGRPYHLGDLYRYLTSEEAILELERTLSVERAKRALLPALLDLYRDAGDAGLTRYPRLLEHSSWTSGEIGALAQGRLARILNTYNPDIRLTDVLQKNMGLYVTLNPLDPVSVSLAKLILADFRAAVDTVRDLPQKSRPRPAFLALLGGFEHYGLPRDARLFDNQAQGAHVSLMPAIASIEALSAKQPELVDILNELTTIKYVF